MNITNEHKPLGQGKSYLVHHKIGGSFYLMKVKVLEVSQKAYCLQFIGVNKTQWIEKQKFDSIGYTDSEFSIFEEL